MDSITYKVFNAERLLSSYAKQLKPSSNLAKNVIRDGRTGQYIATTGTGDRETFTYISNSRLQPTVTLANGTVDQRPSN